MSRRERRRLRKVFALSTAPTRLSGTTVGVVIAVAMCVGLAAGLIGSEPQAAASPPPDKPILWGETQAVPSAEATAEDSAWQARGGGAAAPVRVAADSVHIPFFGYCRYGGGTNCVVDGDTFYYGRDKVRIANIDAPETHPPRCAAEARLGDVATHRLRDLLNSGEITLSSIDRDEDIYGRKLRNVSVGGADVGATLIGAGLARDYAGGRRSWCG